MIYCAVCHVFIVIKNLILKALVRPTFSFFFSGNEILFEATMASKGVFLVNSPNVKYSKEFIEADYDYQITKVASNGGVLMVSGNSF